MAGEGSVNDNGDDAFDGEPWEENESSAVPVVGSVNGETVIVARKNEKRNMIMNLTKEFETF